MQEEEETNLVREPGPPHADEGHTDSPGPSYISPSTIAIIPMRLIATPAW